MLGSENRPDPENAGNQSHGYQLSAGTLYPMPHSMKKAGYLRSRMRIVDGRMRRNYLITAKGREALSSAKEKVRELFGELFEED